MFDGRIGLLVVLLGAVGLYLGQLPQQRLPYFYADLVVSMGHSWRTFWFGGLDRLATVTVDKEVGAFWPQALLVRWFGLHPWTLVAPQIVEGALTVAVLYGTVRPLFGTRAATLAAGAFVLTPVATSVMGHSMEDGALVACLVAAAGLWQRSLRTRGWWSLVSAAAFIGLGFQAKMAQAWFLLPPLVLVEVFVAAHSWQRRLARVTVLLTVAVATSMSWIAVVAAGRHPFIDGTTDDSPVTMVFGYNLFERLGVHVPGSLPFAQADAVRPGKALFAPALLSQWGLLFPLAVVGTVVLAWRLLPRRHDGAERLRLAAITLWTAWLALTLAAFWHGALAHTSYLVALAAPLALLTGAAVPTLVAEFRRRSGLAWALPLAVAVTTGAGVLVQRHYPDFVPGLAVGVGVLGGVAVAALLLVLVGPGAVRVRTVAIGAAIAAVTVVPVVWTGSVLTTHDDGSSNDASAGPGGVGEYRRAADAPLAPDDPGSSTAVRRALAVEAYVAARSPGSRYLLISNRWTALSPLIRYGSREVLAIGGFRGTAPTMDPAGFEALVRSGQGGWFLLAGRPARHPVDDADRVAAAVAADCVRVDPPTALPAHDEQLFDCVGAPFADRR